MSRAISCNYFPNCTPVIIYCIVVSHISCLLSIDCTCRSEIEELKAEIQGIKSDIANIKQLPRSSISSDMDDLESLFSSLDGGCSPFTPLATGTTSHQNLMSPPPLPPTIRPRANSLPSTIPTVGPFSPDHFSYHTPQCTETFQTGDSSQSSRITHSQFAGLPHPSSLAPPTTQPSTSSLLQPATQPSTSSLLQPATQPSTSSLLQPATQPSTSSLLQPATQPSTSSPLQPATQPSTSLFQPVPQPVLQPSTSLFQPVTQPFQLSTQPSTSLFQITTQPSTGLFQLTPQPLIGQPTTQPLTSLTTSSPGPSQQLVPQQQPPSKKLTVPMPIPDYMPIKTAEEVFAKYDKFLTSDMIGRVAVKLARNTFFGEKVLQGSSIGGTEDTRPLDPNKMREMRAVIRKKFPTVSPTEFELLWGKCVDSISRLCTYCRKSK